MEELIKTIADRAGISLDQAKSAIEGVIEHFKDKLPMGIGEKIESFLQGGSSSDGSSDFFSGLKDKFEGLFKSDA